MKYDNLFSRLVANSKVNPDTGCWEWTSKISNRYPRINIWKNGRLVSRRPTRLMLEIIHGYEFPFDEAGHLCYNPICINPCHLEIQTPAFNALEKRTAPVRLKDDRMIPILFSTIQRLKN